MPALSSRLLILPSALALLLSLSGCDDAPSHVALGTLERDRVALTATAAEVVIELPVAEGQMVTKGTVLVKLDDTRQIAVVRQAEAQAAQARAALDKLRNGARPEELAAARARVAGARASLVETQQSFERTRDLQQRGTASKAAYDTALANRNAAEAALKSAEEQLRELENGARSEDLSAAAANLAAAEAAVASQQKVLADLTVVASRDGRLDSLPWNLGERVTQGSPLAILMADGAPFARVYVPEPARVRVKPGDQLTVHVDGLDRELTGTLRWISSEPSFTPYYALNQTERARLMYPAEVLLPDTEADLPSGMPAQVQLP